VTTLLDHPAFTIARFGLLLRLPWAFGQMGLYAGSAEMPHLDEPEICRGCVFPGQPWAEFSRLMLLSMPVTRRR